jgi:hypothetical protein
LVDVRSQGIDGAGHIETENVGVRPGRIATAGEFIVDGVQADGGDPDPDFAIARIWFCHLSQLECLYCSGLFE